MDPQLKRAACAGDVGFLEKAIATQPRHYLVTEWVEYNGNVIVDGRIGNILHLAVWEKQEEFLRLALEEILPTDLALQLLSKPQKSLTVRGNLLHKLACCNSDKMNLGMTQIVLNFYRSYSAGPNNPPLTDAQKPWLALTTTNTTPLHESLLSNHQSEQIAMELLSMEGIHKAFSQVDTNGISPLFGAIRKGYTQVADKILMSSSSYSLAAPNGSTPLHLAPFSSEETAKRMLEKFWWIMNLKNDRGRTALDEAKEANTPWLVNLLMNHSLIHKEPFDWITSCEKDETAAVLAFIDNCEDLHKLYLEQNDTVLHHIKLDTYKEYMKLLKNPAIVELKNATDLNGKTPLHCAIERKDIYLVKALLVDGVERNIKDSNGTTAMKLLATLYNSQNSDWKKMCKDIKVNPLLKTTYIQPGTDVGAMRNTLSVVAALLATITFAAGFTLPGGYNENTGDAIKAKKAAFLVFLISDAYAMCASMLVLFCLIWSMVSTQDMSYLLVDRSVLILMQSLYGTMIAFITGIYAVIATHSLWAAILVIVMCSVVVISANRTFLHIILSKIIPAAASEDQTPKVQEESTTDANGKNSSMNPTLSTANQDQNGHMSVLEAV